MGAAELSLLAVTFGFAGLVWWVYTPARRGRLESYGRMPLEDDGEGENQEQTAAGRPPRTRQPQQGDES